MADEQEDRGPDTGENDASGDESSFDESEPIDARPDDPNIPENPNIQPANLWSRKDIKDFKDAIRKDSAEGVIKIGNGETATIRVPTHMDGTSIFWEFATDHYDIGFGLYFEWTDVVTDKVTVHISESSDEEDEELPEDGTVVDPEQGDRIKDRFSADEIIPIYRRDCHEEVYVGSHPYPGQGIYLLKFDNSFSLWRSKTLYYRVYYSK